MKQQFVVTHTIRQNEIPSLLDGAVMNIPSVKMLCPQKELLVLMLAKKKTLLTCLSFGLLRIG